MKKIKFKDITIGEYQDIINESIGKIGSKIIKVRGFEGPIPHFHIEIPGKPDCCICIFEPLYFIHGSKATKLTKSEMEKLNKWLNEDNKKYLSIGYHVNNWSSIYIEWSNMYNDETKPHTKNIPDNPKQPEYYYNMDNKINIKESTSLFDFDLL